ncbi:MAG: glutaredoxin domain-containing protein [Dehalococcoidales bacterium]|nr:glutaredoxin domain-containing protein [Dehalococcoidales bacterium]
MTEKKVIIYSTPTCAFCKRAKDYLTRKGIAYVDYDVAQDRSKAREMVEKTGQMSVPVIIIEGEIVVGFQQNRLDSLLSQTPESRLNQTETHKP